MKLWLSSPSWAVGDIIAVDMPRKGWERWLYRIRHFCWHVPPKAVRYEIMNIASGVAEVEMWDAPSRNQS